jgi:hypothetical protein
MFDWNIYMPLWINGSLTQEACNILNCLVYLWCMTLFIWWILQFLMADITVAYICIVTYTTCVVVWLITLRGFGLATGFIHYGDL